MTTAIFRCPACEKETVVTYKSSPTAKFVSLDIDNEPCIYCGLKLSGFKKVRRSAKLFLCDKKGYLFHNAIGKPLRLPGGSCESNESDEETLEREIKEELGIYVSNVFLVNRFIQYDDSINTYWLSSVYVCPDQLNLVVDPMLEEGHVTTHLQSTNDLSKLSTLTREQFINALPVFLRFRKNVRPTWIQ